MKRNLKKKRALAAAVLLSLGCYGQAWAEDIVRNDDIKVDANQKINIGSIDDNVSLKNKYIKLDENAIIDIVASKLKIENHDSQYNRYDICYEGNYKLDPTESVNINSQEIYIDGNIMLKDVCLNINQDSEYKNSIVQINGDIYGSNRGIDIGSKVNINFYGKESYLNGSITAYLGNVVFDNYAKWIIPTSSGGSLTSGTIKVANEAEIIFEHDKDKFFTDGHGASGWSSFYAKNFDADGGIVRMNFDGSEGVEKIGEGYYGMFVNSNIIGAENHTGKTKLILNNIGKDSLGAVGTVLAVIDKENGSFEVIKAEGALSWDKYELETKLGTEIDFSNYQDKNHLQQYLDKTYWVISNVTHETAPTTSVSTLLSTVTAGYDTWRNDTDKFNERMGELRLNGAGNDGVWVRTKGSEFGRHSSNGSYTNKQQTYQLGYDAVTSKDDKQTTYTGVAAEYGKGSLSFDSGTGTMKSIGMGVYQTKMYESGHYLDLVGRFDKYKNDFHVADTQGNAISGKYGNNALSLSVEYGRKNELKHGWYVEPQSEVTLGYMFGNDFTTSNNIRVEQKNMPALIGRLGLNIGREVNDKVNFYVKASVNHDFLGNYDVQMTDMTSGERLGASDRFGSSWFDYGAGLSVKTGKDSYAYFDIERAVGGEYKKNWDWNAGVRWSF